MKRFFIVFLVAVSGLLYAETDLHQSAPQPERPKVTENLDKYTLLRKADEAFEKKIAELRETFDNTFWSDTAKLDAFSSAITKIEASRKKIKKLIASSNKYLDKLAALEKEINGINEEDFEDKSFNQLIGVANPGSRAKRELLFAVLKEIEYLKELPLRLSEADVQMQKLELKGKVLAKLDDLKHLYEGGYIGSSGHYGFDSLKDAFYKNALESDVRDSKLAREKASKLFKIVAEYNNRE